MGSKVQKAFIDESITLWYYLSGHKHQVTTFCYSKSGTHIISGDEGGEIKIWDTCSYECVKNLKAHDCGARVISVLSVSDDNGFIR